MELQPAEENMGRTHSKEECMWAMLCHLSALCIMIIPPVGGLLGPFVVWLIKRDDMPLVADQGKESLNFQITVLLAGALATLLIGVGIGLLLLWALAIYYLVMVVIASVKANEGRAYRYPLTLRLIK